MNELTLLIKKPLLKTRVSESVFSSLYSIHGTNCIPAQIFRCILQGKIEANVQGILFVVSLKGIRWDRKSSFLPLYENKLDVPVMPFTYAQKTIS
jgi:hypothetical protein